MSGPFSVVQARLRAKSPQVIYIYCQAHKLNLVIASCVESVSTVGSFFFTGPDSIHIHFQH